MNGPSSHELPPPPLSVLTDLVIREVLINFHLRETGGLASLFHFATYLPARGFARLVQRIECDVQALGLHGAASNVLRHFVTRLEIRGWATPPDGPLLVAANHPGGTDPFVMTAAIPRRDLHILSQQHLIFNALPNLSQCLICMAEDRSDGYLALRKMMALLQTGKSILVYPGGDLELDPALFPATEPLLRDWSRSVSLVLSRMPEVIVQPAILRGTISREAWRSRLTRLGRSVTTRLQIAMIFQIAMQQLKPDAFPVQTTLILGKPLKAREMGEALDPPSLQQALMTSVNEILRNDPLQYPLLEEIIPAG